MSLSFNYSSSTLTPANVNISGKDLKTQSLPQPLDPKENNTHARLFSPSTGTYQQVNLILEAGETKSVKEINYENITLSALSQIYSTNAILPPVPEKKIVLKNNLDRIQVSLSNTTTQYDLTQTPAENNLLPENQNCDQFNDGITVKQVTPNGFLYQSQNASECDTLNLRHLPHSLNYLLTVDLQTQRGLAPTICLENHTSRRCDVQERLINTKDTQSIIQPINNPNEPPGYTLHLYNQSFGSAITSNLIKNITIRPLPLQFLQNITITSPSSDVKPKTPSLQSSHPYPFLYTATVKVDSSLRGTEGDVAIPASQVTLNLYQTQSPFWQAFKIKNQSSLPIWLNFISLFSAQKLNFSSSVNWYNAWIIPEDSNSVVILYLPQYLEFFGLLLLVITPLTVLLFSIPKKLHKKASH